jgi:hypothetical protein
MSREWAIVSVVIPHIYFSQISALQMCDHSKSTYPIKTASDLKPDPRDPEKCHIYYVHQDGKILCEPNVQFKPGKNPSQKVTSLNDEGKNKGGLFCGEDRLTLV